MMETRGEEADADEQKAGGYGVGKPAVCQSPRLPPDDDMQVATEGYATGNLAASVQRPGAPSTTTAAPASRYVVGNMAPTCAQSPTTPPATSANRPSFMTRRGDESSVGAVPTDQWTMDYGKSVCAVDAGLQ